MNDQLKLRLKYYHKEYRDQWKIDLGCMVELLHGIIHSKNNPIMNNFFFLAGMFVFDIDDKYPYMDYDEKYKVVSTVHAV